MALHYDGIVLAGGRSHRMGADDKTRLEIGGRSLRASAIAALAHATTTVVVGPDGDVLEEPAGSGPLAALAAGLSLVSAPVVAVLAADLPFVTPEVVDQLVAVAPALAVDGENRAQYLLAAYRTADLRRLIPAQSAGVSLRSVVESMKPRRIRLETNPPPWWDCDTPAELAQARSWHDAR